jgi:hypothetical protein
MQQWQLETIQERIAALTHEGTHLWYRGFFSLVIVLHEVDIQLPSTYLNIHWDSDDWTYRDIHPQLSVYEIKCTGS